MEDQPLHFHKSFSSLLDTFHNVIVGITWLKASLKNAEVYFKDYPYIITLPCSVTNKEIKIDKLIISLIKKEDFQEKTPLYTQTLINFYRILTIAVNDIIWEERDFFNLHRKPELKFLRYIRNASAHNNQFYWGKGKQRARTLKSLPVVWNGKEIKKDMENTPLYMNFLAPGDLFILLSDISKLVEDKKKAV